MKTRIFLTGATGTMGSQVCRQLLENPNFQVKAIVQNTRKELAAIRALQHHSAGGDRLTWYLGDIRHYEDVKKGVDGADIVLHMAALISPAADYLPKLSMEVNYGSTLHLIRAIKAQADPQAVHFVFIGSVAQTGGRMPPIHWGRVGDPIKPSIHDYYAVAKVAAEREVIESGLTNWVVLRQTGILSPAMAAIEDGIIFHNCLDNVLEYVSDFDSGVLIRRICETLPDPLWGEIFNIGGGAACRMSFYDELVEMLRRLGINDAGSVFEANWFALHNFHGQYYLDSDRLQEIVPFRSHGMEYFLKIYDQRLGWIKSLAQTITRFKPGRQLITSVLRKRFGRIANSAHAPLRYLQEENSAYYEPQFVSREAWDAIPAWDEFPHFRDWERVVPIDHGYDETKPTTALDWQDMQRAARFRGGKCLSTSMQTGNLSEKLQWECAFGHAFQASPRLILKAGHWCPYCENQSWNYHAIARVNPFFAQVWYPLHSPQEPAREYPKLYSPEDVLHPPEPSGISANTRTKHQPRLGKKLPSAPIRG